MRGAFIGAWLIGACGALAAPDDRFRGGSFDGHAQARQTAYVRDGSAPWFSPRFRGGPRDGHAVTTRATYAPDGMPSWFSDRFRGGPLDGFFSAERRTYEVGVSPHLHSLRFRGGARDGHERILVLGIPSPLAGDHDGDGLPDWWEAFYYQSLTATDGPGDTDRDGSSAATEYAAGTDPTQALSVFEITFFAAEGVGSPGAVIQWSSVTNKAYRIAVSTNLKAGFHRTITNLPATPPLNVHTDATATGTGLWLYRIELE